MFESSLYLVFIYGLGILFLIAAVAALYWSAKSGQLRNFEKGARVIFTKDEPEGVHRDVFPGKKGRRDMQRLAEDEEEQTNKHDNSKDHAA